MAHFATSEAYKKTNASLINIKQGKDETLKSYLERFNKAALEIKDLPPVVAIHSILVGLKFDDFSKSLAKKPIETLTERLNQLAKFINMEDVKGGQEIGQLATQPGQKLI